ncbi:MAG: glutamine--fructose-6-phosphate transaminase (isomerizing) [Candidatus Nanohaloarchaea archaeon]
MCGIVGYYGEEDTGRKIFEGLKKLEYRGYDSAGIATVGNPSVKVEKGTGTIDEAIDFASEDFGEGAGIGHTRWATHGGVTDENAHPHRSSSGDIAVVHNGIIDNYRELKENYLQDQEFRSETDTEVIPRLIERMEAETDDFYKAVEKTVELLEGSYAVVAVKKTGEMAAFKESSPLVLGVMENEYFLASDVTPFLEYTDKAVFLEDGDILRIQDNEYSIKNRGEQVERDITHIDWDAEEASKEGHDHFMQKEIKEQPDTVKKAAFQDRSDVEKAVEMIEEAETVYLTGCGTSSYAADLGARYLRNAGFDVVSEQSHEMEYWNHHVEEEDLVIAFSQSGETADLLSMLEEVDAPVLSIVNVVGSTLARKSEQALYINAGPEIGVASTKAFTAQLAVIKLIAETVNTGLESARNSLIETADRIENVLRDNRESVEEISDYLLEKEHVYFIGREKGFEVAKESSLKLKELSYIHSEAFPGGEFKHGTIALVEEGTPVVAFMHEKGLEDIFSNAKEAESRGADIIGVGRENHGNFKYFLRIPEDENSEILEVALFQLLAYRTAVKKGHNPDKPRNLAKSVTVK